MKLLHAPARSGALLVFSLLCLTIGSRLGAAESSHKERALSCLKLQVGMESAWVHEGAWHGFSLLATDVFAGAIHVLDVETHRIRTIRYPGRGKLELNKPSLVRPVGSDFMVWDSEEHLVWLNPSLEPYRGLYLERLSARKPVGLASFEAVVDDAGQRLVVYGDLNQNDDWRSVYLRIDLSSRRIVPVQSVDAPQPRSQARQYYAGMNSFSARVGDEAIFLELEKAPRFVAVSEKSVRVFNAFPPRFLPVPSLNQSSQVGPGNVHEIAAANEKRSLPYGLYAGSESLFLLTREPHPDGGTRWSLFTIDPVNKIVGRELVLPSRAAHLSLVAGADYWGVIANGSVDIGGGHTWQHLLVLPTQWIEGETSPLDVALASSSDITCQGVPVVH